MQTAVSYQDGYVAAPAPWQSSVSQELRSIATTGPLTYWGSGSLMQVPVLSVGAGSLLTPGLVEFRETRAFITVPADRLDYFTRPVGAASSTHLVNPKLAALLRTRFALKGRDARITMALAAVEAAVFDYGLDAETVRAIVEDEDIEDV